MTPPLAPTLEPPSAATTPEGSQPAHGDRSLSLGTGPRSLVVALGFATTVVMWAIGYACMTAPGLIVGEVLFLVELLALVAGGYVAGRMLGTIKAGAWTGLVSATVNLLIVGSLFRRGEDGSILGSAVAWVLGLYLVSVLLSSLGAVAGARNSPPRRLPSATGLFSVIAAGTVFLLLITGGLVTGLEAGLAVPDWPNSFGHNMLLYPLAEMSGGIYYEHAHRLYGMLVGVTSIALMVMVFVHDRRSWIRVLIVAVFLMVCVQGLMGGLRVTGQLTLSQENTTPNIILAIAHGIFGQVVFAGFCLLAVASSRP
ncbi:MAG: COX15/CtaA family protein, partial [Phycisphaerales bacterium]|nr:COX15/CtaA family protein [Phycisphaerales bacterium]